MKFGTEYFLVRFFGLPFNLGSSFTRRPAYITELLERYTVTDPTLTKEEREYQKFKSDISDFGCKSKRIEWARIESHLPPINIDVRRLV